MSYDFLDANQVNDFRTKAKAKGLDRVETEQYIRTRKSQQMKEQQVGLDIKKQEVEGLKLDAEKSSLLSGEGSISAAGQEKQRFASLSRNTLEKMRSIYGLGDSKNVGTNNDLSAGPGMIAGAGRLAESAIAGVTGFSSNKREQYKQFNDLAQMLVGQLSQAFGSGTPQEGEAKRLIDSMPTRKTTDQTAKAWFENVDYLLAQSAGEDVGMLKEETPYDEEGRNLSAPALSITGEIAKSGDLVYNEQTGSYYSYGDQDTDEQTVFKTTQSGGVIDNSFIKWLADSEFLPIAGSIVGGISGAGIASVGTGAAGALVGKSMQQGLRELVDPERQDMSDMATAVLIEGATDALIGGAMFGIGLAAKSGFKFIIGKTIKEGAEEGIEAGTKKAIRDKVARGLNVKPSVEQARYARSFNGADLVDDIMAKFGIPKSGRALKESAEVAGKEAGQKVTSLLADQTAKTADVIKALKEVQQTGTYTTIKEGIEEVIPKADFGRAVNKINEYIAEIANYGDEIPLQKLNEIKTRLQKSFTKSLETSSLSKGLMQDAATNTRQFIEEQLEQTAKGMGVELAETNKLKMLSYMAGQIGERLDQKKAKAIIQFGDLVVGAANPVLLAGKKAVDVFSGVFNDPLTQAKIMQTGLNMAVSNGNRVGVRNILRFMSRLGVSWTAGIGASSVAKSVEPDQTQEPGLNLEEPTQEDNVQPGFMYR